MPDHAMDHCGNHFRDHQCDYDDHQYHHRLLGICFLQPRLHNALCLLHHGRLLIQVFVQYSMKLIASKWRTLGLNLSINPEKIVFFFFRKQLLEKNPTAKPHMKKRPRHGLRDLVKRLMG